MSRGAKDESSIRSNIGEKRANPVQPDNSASQDEADKDIDNVITIANHKNTLQSFIEKSTLGVQFAIIVLFYLARASLTSTSKSITPEQSIKSSNLSAFSFTSREFFDAYSHLASDMGLTKYLVRHMAFAEYILTLEYLALVREDELTANYHFRVDFEDLKWLATLALQQIAGGHGLSSPETFYRSPSRSTLQSETSQTDKTVSTPTMDNPNIAAELIKDLSRSIFSREEIELNLGGGTSRSYDDFVRPRSSDYGVHRPFFPHRVPPTMYSFRRPNDGEWKRIIKEFFEGQKCVMCDAEVLPQQFEVWIGEPLEDNAIPSSKSDQRMSEVPAEIDNISSNRGKSDDDAAAVVGTSADKQQIIDSDKSITDRELLIRNYGIIPMDGRDAFIAFAKPKLPCPNCGANPGNSVSLMPRY